MRRALGVLCVVALAGCFSPVGEFGDGGSGGGAGGSGGVGGAGGTGGSGGSGGSGGTGGSGGSGGGGSGACAVDSQCTAGMVCESCPGQDNACVPGCRNDAQCRTGEVCQLGVSCLTCPCAPGWCVDDPCIDKDGDGVVASCDKSLSCPGKQKCDCDPFNAGVYPGAAERCSNGIDDDCDGLVDGADPSCQVCMVGQKACTSALDCGVGTATCLPNGCCEQCPSFPPLLCNAGQCPYAGTGRNGCQQSQCAPCGGNCTAVYQPVCGFLGAITRTFGNACEAGSAQATIVHEGECLPGEGLSCGFGTAGTCGSAMYCRDACPLCDDGYFACTKVGACVYDWDCPAGQAPATCPSGKKLSYACVANACVSSCQ